MKIFINQPSIVYEIIDQEVVIMNVNTGTYYSLIGMGTFVWRLLEQHAHLGQIIQAISRCYEGTIVHECIESFLSHLEQEKIIFKKEEEENSIFVTENEFIEKKAPFHPPILEVHPDLKELFMLDIIHDVSDEGWPHALN